MKRVLLVLGSLLFAYFAGRAVIYALASDETRIRWKIERMFEGYNAAQPGMAVSPLHEDWRHEGHELDRELLRGALFRVSMQDRDRETKELISRVELLPDSLLISMAGDEADLELVAVFSRQKDGEWTERWRMQLEAQLRNGDDGWKIITSRHRDLKGTQLSR